MEHAGTEESENDRASIRAGSRARSAIRGACARGLVVELPDAVPVPLTRDAGKPSATLRALSRSTPADLALTMLSGWAARRV